MYIVYKTDVHHTYKSRDMIAICTSKKYLMRAIKKQVEKEDSKLDPDQLYNLEHIQQTQGYDGPGEFVYEKVSANTLL
ncbi:MAG: hypothetical protein ACTHMM_27000 [Agriterribacter sp.]